MCKEVIGNCLSCTHNITSWIVLADGVLSPHVVALDVGTSQFHRGLPNKLGKVTSGRRESWRREAVLQNFIVPSIHRFITSNIASSQVLTVRTSGVDKLNIVTVEMGGSVMCGVVSHDPIPGHWWSTV